MNIFREKFYEETESRERSAYFFLFASGNELVRDECRDYLGKELVLSSDRMTANFLLKTKFPQLQDNAWPRDEYLVRLKYPLADSV